MDRCELESTLNDGRTLTLRKWLSLPESDLLRRATRSEHDPDAFWSAKDHLAHLAGIELRFIEIVRSHVAAEPHPVGFHKDDGSPMTRDEIMPRVHAMTEAWVRQHRDKSLSQVVALGQETRARTLALIAGLTEAQLLEKVPGAPWADGTVAGILATNADHARMHWTWLTAGLAEQA